MGFPTLVAWSVLFGLSLMTIGGLVLWSQGLGGAQDTGRAPIPLDAPGPEAEATRHFHGRLKRWFFIYGCSAITLGAVLLLWAASIFL